VHWNGCFIGLTLLLLLSLPSVEVGFRLEPALNTEVAYARWVYKELAGNEEMLKSLNGPSGGSLGQRFFFGLYRATGMAAKDQLFYLSEVEGLLQAVSLPPSERVSVNWPPEDGFSTNPLDGEIIASILLPVLGRPLELDTRGITYLRAVQIALAAEQYRLQQGLFPLQPDDLVPIYFEELPTDPYSGSEGFQFILKENGFVVRSSGTLPQGEEQSIQFRLPVRRGAETFQ